MQARAGSVGRVLAVLFVVAAVACSWWPAIENVANQQVDAGLKRALVSFGVAKTLNAAISVAQGTELAFQPVGVGVTVTVGQILDPLNDLIEQFASMMLTASVAFGVQKALLAIGAHWLISAAVTGVAVVWALLWWRGRAPAWLSRALLVLIMARFAIPVITIGGDWVFQRFLADNYQQAQGELDKISVTASEPVIAAPATGKDEGFWEKVMRWKEAAESIDVQSRLADLQQAVSRATDHVVELMVVFVMQTIIVPIALLWALLKVAGGVLFWRPLPAAGN